ncbi:hypothetical protein BDV19DRAFT_393189 [Aspergillus venezuelensis]
MAGPNTRNNPGNKGKARAVPEDRDAVGDEGVAQAEREQGQSLSSTAQTIARHLEIVRDLDWSLNSGDQVTRGWWQRLALVLQRRGDVSNPACERCQEDDGTRGVFTSCVSAPGLEGKAFQNGACANCIWINRGRSCSLIHGVRALDGETLRKWLQDGEESLRTAITREMIQNTETEEEYIETDHEKYEDENENNENQENVKPQQEQRQQPQPNHECADADTFFGAFTPGSPFTRVGHSQRGPRCFFDGTELQFPISREIWRDRARLAVARSDLAHFAAIIDARLFEQGSGEGGNDYIFWNREARRLLGLYPLPNGWRQRVQRAPRVESSSESSSGGGPDDDGNGGAQINDSSESRESQAQASSSGHLRAPVQTAPGSQRSPARDPRPQARRHRAEAQSQSQKSALGPLLEIPHSQPQSFEDRETPIIVVTEGTTQGDVDAAIWANAPNYGLRNYLDGVNHNVEPEEAEAARQYYEEQFARLAPQLRRFGWHTYSQLATGHRYPFPVEPALAYPAQQDYHRAQPTYTPVTHSTYTGYERYPPMYPQSQPQPQPYSDAPWRQETQAHNYPPPPEPQTRQYPRYPSPILWGQRRDPFRHPRTPSTIPRPDQIHSSLRPLAQEPISESEAKPQSDPLPLQQSIEYSDNSEEQEQDRTQDDQRPHVSHWQLAQGWAPTRNENEPRAERPRQEEEGGYSDEIPKTQQEQQEEGLPDYEDEEQQTQQEESNTRAAQADRQDSQSGAAPTFSSFRHEQDTASPATTDDNRFPSHSPSYQGNRPTGIKQPIFDLTARVQAGARGEDRDRASVERAGQRFKDIATSAVDRSFGSGTTGSEVRQTARKSMYRPRNRDEEAEGDEKPIKRRRISNEEE